MQIYVALLINLRLSEGNCINYPDPDIINFKAIFICIQEFYRTLLKAESEGNLTDVDMTKVEKIILDPERKEE